MIGRLARAAFSASALAANTIVSVAALLPLAIVKLLLPQRARAPVDRALNAIARSWVRLNGAWIAAVARVRWDVRRPEGLDPGKWYLVCCNHQSWVDIFVLQSAFSGRVPLLKFLLKRELRYVPLMGFAWWALDFPFLDRGGGAHARRADLAATRRACERFRAVPTAVLSFLEGTRYTPQKARARASPYRHLLEPRIGGLATALRALSGRVDAVLDVTIVYPGGVPSFLDLLCGSVGEVVVRARVVPLPRSLVAPGAAEADFRGALKRWAVELWREKDRRIDEVMRQAGSSAPVSLRNVKRNALKGL